MKGVKEGRQLRQTAFEIQLKVEWLRISTWPSPSLTAGAPWESRHGSLCDTANLFVLPNHHSYPDRLGYGGVLSSWREHRSRRDGKRTNKRRAGTTSREAESERTKPDSPTVRRMRAHEAYDSRTETRFTSSGFQCSIASSDAARRAGIKVASSETAETSKATANPTMGAWGARVLLR